MNGELGIYVIQFAPSAVGRPAVLPDVRMQCPIAVVVRAGFTWLRRVMDFLMTPRYRVYLFTRRPHGAFFYLQALDTQERIIRFAARFFAPRVLLGDWVARVTDCLVVPLHQGG